MMIPFKKIERAPFFGVGFSVENYNTTSKSGYPYKRKKYYWAMGKAPQDIENLFYEPEIDTYWIYDLSVGVINAFGCKFFLPIDSTDHKYEITSYRIEEIVNDPFNQRLQ